MDISEIWNHLVYFAAPFIAILLFLFTRRIHRKWLRLTLCSGAILLFLISSLILLIDGFWLMKMTVRRPSVVSPDGKHVAVALWTGVIWDENCAANAHIFIRRRFSPIASEVYTHEVVQRECTDITKVPAFRWLDDHRLLVSRSDNGQIKDCSPGSIIADGIEILCQE
jgi:hypothetical protein